MKVVDLHPDDLLDKEARGELTAVERERLETHLARCETCRFEREVRDDFAEELFMTEEDIPSQRLPALIPGLDLDETEVAPKKVAGDVERSVERRVSTRPARVRKNLRVALLVAAALLIGSAATAGAGGRVWAHVASALSLESTTAEAPPVTSAAVPQAAPVKQARVVAPVPTELVVPDTKSEPATSAIVPVSLSAVETPASLFEAANKARNAGDYGQAITLHRKLETTYPRSREAHTSYATLGRLLLDRGDAMGALQAFDAYQAKGPGPLDEAVLVGRATALERLGREGEARTAWSQLLREFPDTPYREHAESKLKKP